MRYAPPLILALAIGCSGDPPPHSEPPATQSAVAEAGIEGLGDRIAGLTLTEANELSEYLSHVHGIIPAGGKAVDSDERRDRSEFANETASLGDEIAALTLSQSTTLSDYLATKHGIKPASSSEANEMKTRFPVLEYAREEGNQVLLTHEMTTAERKLFREMDAAIVRANNDDNVHADYAIVESIGAEHGLTRNQSIAFWIRTTFSMYEPEEFDPSQ